MFSHYTTTFSPIPFIHILYNTVSVFSIATDFSSISPPYFELEDKSLTATEGSCVEIKCLIKIPVDPDSRWFWIKNAKWDESNKNFSGSIVYSSNSLYTVDPAYATRVKYAGSPISTWNDLNVAPRCSILICDLQKEDSGEYFFRFNGYFKWRTQNLQLTITGKWQVESLNAINTQDVI